MAILDIRTPKARPWVLGSILIICTILVYHPAWNAGFIWDDDDYVTKNPLLTAADGLWRIWFSLDSPSQYFPLVYTSFRIERMLWGLNASGYHWVNIFLHTVNALLVWKLLARLNLSGAWIAAMIFALHPVHVESVAWITERKNVLMGFFFLLTLLTWIAFIDERSKQRWIIYVMALVAYALALTAKTTACTLPAAMFLILWLQKRAIDWRRIREIVPFVFLGLAMGLVTLWWERYHVGTRGALFALGPAERLLVASHAVWFYLGKLFWPSNLTFIYPQWNILPSDPLAYGWLLAAIGACVVVYFARRAVGRSLEVALLFFAATLSPLLGFIMLYTFRYTFVADHYQYLASIGPIALTSAGLMWFGHLGKQSKRIAIGVCIAIFVSLGALTWRQCRMYSDIETLWRTTITKNPGCWMAYNNLGIALTDSGNLDAAILQYRKSLELHADYAQAHYNLGLALLDKGRIDEAIGECQSALFLEPRDADAHVALGNALLAQGSADSAIREYNRALELRPNHVDARYNLGNALLRKGDADAAISQLAEALRLEPTLFSAHLQLGNALLEKSSWRDAIEHYEQALKISPDSISAQNNLAWILATASDFSFRNGRRAVQLGEQAQQASNQEDPILLHTLAAAYAEDRQFDKAAETAERALKLALNEGASPLVNDLEREIRLYRAHSTFQAR